MLKKFKKYIDPDKLESYLDSLKKENKAVTLEIFEKELNLTRSTAMKILVNLVNNDLLESCLVPEEKKVIDQYKHIDLDIDNLELLPPDKNYLPAFRTFNK